MKTWKHPKRNPSKAFQGIPCFSCKLASFKQAWEIPQKHHPSSSIRSSLPITQNQKLTCTWRVDIGSTNSNSCQYTFYFKTSLFPVQLVVWFKNFGELGMVQAFRSKWNISVWGVVWRKSSNCKSSRTFQTIKEGGIPPKNGLSISHQRGIFREIASKVPTSGGGAYMLVLKLKSQNHEGEHVYIYIYIYISSGQIIIFHLDFPEIRGPISLP